MNIRHLSGSDMQIERHVDGAIVIGYAQGRARLKFQRLLIYLDIK